MRRYVLPSTLAILLAAAGAVHAFHLHFIYTESAPLGLWRAEPRAIPRVGEFARFCMRPAEARATAGRPYAGGSHGGPCPFNTWMLAKPVVATAGDTVVHRPDAVIVNGRRLPRSATRTHDSQGLAVPIAPFGMVILREGEYWMHSQYADGSFDSRYLGVVAQEQVRGVVRPVMTWLNQRQRATLHPRER